MNPVHENIGYISSFLETYKEKPTGEQCLSRLEEIRAYVSQLERVIATEISFDRLDELRKTQ